jgi:hypothetical protein
LQAQDRPSHLAIASIPVLQALPILGYYESIDSIRGYESIQANNFEFTRQFFLLLPCYLLVKLQFKGKSDFASSRSTVASRDCINPCSTGSLLKEFTFDAPDHQSSYTYSKCLSIYSFRVSRLHKSLFYKHFAVYPIHFRSARTSALLVVSSTCIYKSISKYTRIFFDTVV